MKLANRSVETTRRGGGGRSRARSPRPRRSPWRSRERGQGLRLEVLGEHRRVVRGGAVDRGRRLHDELAHARRLLARREQLHRADDVDLFHRRPAAGAERASRCTAMCTTVSTSARVMTLPMTGLRMSARTNSASPRSLLGRHDVDADDPGDVGVGLQQLGEPAAEVARHPGDQRRPGAIGAPIQRCAAAAGYFLLRRWTRVFFSSLRCFFFAIRLRRFLMTEPTRPLRVGACQVLWHGCRWRTGATPDCRAYLPGTGRRDPA